MDAKAYSRNANKKYRMKTRAELIEFLGGKCSFCDFSDHRAIQIDHIHGGGSAEMKRIQNSLSKVRALVLEHGATHYQLLCANCNWIKRYENQEYKAPSVKNKKPFTMELFEHGR